MMELLLKVEDRGYPSDYLLSRIKGRRAGLVSGWPVLIYGGTPFEYLASSSYRGFVTATSPGGFWRDLMKEYRWVYLRMNRALLEIFRPFFLYCELRTIFICLRHIKGGTALRTGEVLFSSLLSNEMKNVLGESGDVSTAVRDIEKAFLNLSSTFAGVAEVWDLEGLGGFERELTVRYLVTAVRNGLHPLMKEFFVRIIDSRNIISFYKFLRLHPRRVPTFIPCGSINGSRFAWIIERKDIHAIYRLAGIKEEGPAPANVERTLYRNMTVFLRKAGKDPLGVGAVLDYLWRCEREIVNLRILSYGRDIGRETLDMEVVR